MYLQNLLENFTRDYYPVKFYCKSRLTNEVLLVCISIVQEVYECNSSFPSTASYSGIIIVVEN